MEIVFRSATASQNHETRVDPAFETRVFTQGAPIAVTGAPHHRDGRPDVPRSSAITTRRSA
jgi:hypothetical protein